MSASRRASLSLHAACVSILCSSFAWGQAPALRLQDLTASLPSADDGFGSDLALGVDYALVGAPLDDDLGVDAGAVYLYREAGGSWLLAQKFYSPDPDPGDRFGAHVALFGSDLAVGAPGDDERALDAGAAYSMQLSPAGGAIDPNSVVKLTAPDGGPQDGFGIVARGSDLLLVGAPGHDLPQQDSGAAYAYYEDLGGPLVLSSSSAPEKLTKAAGSRHLGCQVDVANSGRTVILACDGQATTFSYSVVGPFLESTSYFTTSPSDPPSVAISPPWIAVGEPTANSRSGEVRIYRLGSPPLPEAIVTSDDPSAFDEFGASLDSQLGRFLIGAPFGDWSGPDRGAAYLIELQGGLLGTWPVVASHLELASTGSVLRAGFAVALAQDYAAPTNRALVAAAFHDRVSTLDSEGVSVFSLGVGPWSDFCFGLPDTPGVCPSCPCGNGPTTFERGGCRNSAGRSARLDVEGLPHLSMDTLRFDLRGATSQTFALLLSGDRQLSVPGCPGSGVLGVPAMDGMRCIGMNLVRHGLRAVDADGRSLSSWGGGNSPSGLLAQGGFQAGQTRYFQAFYREDDAQGCGTGMNTSQGIEVSILP